MIRAIKENPFLRFLVLAALTYAVWAWLYHGYINPYANLDIYIIENLIDLSGGAMEQMGYTLIPEAPPDQEERTVGIDGTVGLWIGDPCNGVNLFALFIIFMIWYPGPIKDKLWFIPFGLLTMHLLNVVRIIALSILVTYDYKYLDFNHTYTFTILVNGYMFLLWLWWAKRYSGLEISKPSSP